MLHTKTFVTELKKIYMATVFIRAITNGDGSLLSCKFKSFQHICISEVLELRTTTSNQQGKSLFDEHHKQDLAFLLNRFQKFRD